MVDSALCLFCCCVGGFGSTGAAGVGAGTEFPLNEQVQAGKVGHHFQTRVGDEKVSAVAAVTATRQREVPRSRSDDEHTPATKGQDDPLEIRHCRGQRDLMDDHDLPDHVEDAVLLSAYSGELAVRIGAAKTHIIQTINNDRCLSWETGAVGAHLR